MTENIIVVFLYILQATKNLHGNNGDVFSP